MSKKLHFSLKKEPFLGFIKHIFTTINIYINARKHILYLSKLYVWRE